MTTEKQRKERKYLCVLLLIFVMTVGLRIYMAYQTPNFSEDAYFTYRQVDSITNNLVPTYNDKLSYSGRVLIFQPLYYYLLAPFAYIMGTDHALKIMPNIFAGLLVIVIFLIVKYITKSEMTALFSGFASGFIPAFFANTINSASAYTLTIPLIMYLAYCFMRSKEKTYLHQFIGLSFVLAITSELAFVFVLAMLIYFVLIKLDYKTENKREVEILLFSTVLIIWVNILIYKKAFLQHSYLVIWQNLPIQILANFFKDINVLDAVTGIGVLPLLFGIIAIHKHMLKEKDRRTYLLMAFALSVTLLLWFKMISFDVGLMFLGVILIPLFGQSLNSMAQYLEKTRISRYRSLLVAGIIILFILTSVLPSVARGSVEIGKAVNEADINALEWIERNTPEDSVIMATIDEGYLITAIAKRKNVADDKFLLIRNPDEIYEDIGLLYKTILKTKAVEILNKYNVNYIYFSPKTKEITGVEELKFAEPDCFELVYDKEVKIYKTLCTIKTAD